MGYHAGKGVYPTGRWNVRTTMPSPSEPMNLRNLKEVNTPVVGMIYLMRRVVTTRDDGSYAYAGRTGFGLLARVNRPTLPS